MIYRHIFNFCKLYTIEKFSHFINSIDDIFNFKIWTQFLLVKIRRFDGMALEFDPQPGDVIVASNHVVLHGRTAYVDDDNAGQNRHMLRLWLTIPNGRPLPPHYAQTREFGPSYARRMA